MNSNGPSFSKIIIVDRQWRWAGNYTEFNNKDSSYGFEIVQPYCWISQAVIANKANFYSARALHTLFLLDFVLVEMI